MIVKRFTGIESIKVEISTKVTIVRGQEFKVSVSGDDAEEVKIQQSGSEIEISYSGASDSFSFFGGSISAGNVIIGGNTGGINVVSGGKNISIVNGKVYIDGKRADESGSIDSNTPVKKPVEIEIQCPDGLSIDCILTHKAVLGAFPEFDRARITLIGAGDAGLQAKTGKLKISGAGDIIYKSLGGDLNMEVGGSGNIKATGSFADVEASVHGCGDICTSGVVRGDYEADVRGVGNIQHSGQISGRKRKSISGVGTVRW